MKIPNNTKDIWYLIYTTNTFEGYHRQIRKATKNKGVFTSDATLEKLVFLTYRNILEIWTMLLANRALMSQQLAIKFGDRYEFCELKGSSAGIHAEGYKVKTALTQFSIYYP